MLLAKVMLQWDLLNAPAPIRARPLQLNMGDGDVEGVTEASSMRAITQGARASVRHRWSRVEHLLSDNVCLTK